MKRVLIGTLFFFALTTNVVSEENSFWVRYLEIRMSYENNFNQLVVQVWPRLVSILNISRDIQITELSIRNVEINYLLEKNSDNIILDEGLYKFIHFSLTKRQEEDLKVSDPAYLDLKRQLESLKKQMNGHPLWPEATGVLTRLVQNQAYLELIQKMETDMNQLHTEMLSKKT